MTTILLNECGDWAIRNGGVVLISGADEIRQSWLIHIRTFLNEWFLDANIGVPYFEVPGVDIEPITSKRLTRRTLKDIFTTATLGTPGVLTVVSVIVNDFNAELRTAEVTVEATIDAPDGDSAIFKYSGSFPPDGCAPSSAEVPFLIQSGELVTWFDPTDRSLITFDGAGVVTNVANKAGPGFMVPMDGAVFNAGGFGGRGAWGLPQVGFQNWEWQDTPGVRFAPIAANNDMTIFCVFHATTAKDQTVFSIFGDDSGVFESQVFGLNDAPGMELRLNYESNGLPPTNDAVLGYNLVPTFMAVRTIGIIGVAQFIQAQDQFGDTGELQVDTPPGYRTVLTNGAGNLGLKPFEGFEGVEGDIGDFLIFRGFLSNNDMAAMKAYLIQKWGI